MKIILANVFSFHAWSNLLMLLPIYLAWIYDFPLLFGLLIYSIVMSFAYHLTKKVIRGEPFVWQENRNRDAHYHHYVFQFLDTVGAVALVLVGTLLLFTHRDMSLLFWMTVITYLISLGIITRQQDQSKDYSFLHGMWHAFGSLSFSLLILHLVTF